MRIGQLLLALALPLSSPSWSQTQGNFGGVVPAPPAGFVQTPGDLDTTGPQFRALTAGTNLRMGSRITRFTAPGVLGARGYAGGEAMPGFAGSSMGAVFVPFTLTGPGTYFLQTSSSIGEDAFGDLYSVARLEIRVGGTYVPLDFSFDGDARTGHLRGRFVSLLHDAVRNAREPARRRQPPCGRNAFQGHGCRRPSRNRGSTGPD